MSFTILRKKDEIQEETGKMPKSKSKKPTKKTHCYSLKKKSVL